MSTTNNEERKKRLEAEATAAPPTDTTSWDESKTGEQALKGYNDAKGAVNKHNEKGFTFSNNDWLTNVLSDIKGFKDFSYDINGDALYQQYKDKYIQQGKLAMMDTMGQAAAMTGGYGNSYAQSVGQQAYQGQLQNLNDIVPELYQMALNKYAMDKENLYDQYGLLMSEYEREYGKYSDDYNKLLDALGIASDDYYKGADMYYAEQSNKNDDAWEKAKWDEGIRQYIEGLLYQEGRDKVSDEQWQKEYEAKYGTGSDGVKYTGNTGTTPGGNTYNNGTLDSAKVEALQRALGVEVDGMYGPKSKEAAGGLTADEAYKKFVGGNGGSGFTGSTYNEAVAYMKSKGVPNANASSVMTQSEWARRKSSYQSTGQGGTEVKNYSSYKEYLNAYIEYAIETYG